MPIDPSIISSIKQYQAPNLLGMANEAAQLKAVQNQRQMQEYAFQQKQLADQQDAEKTNFLRQAYQQSYDPTTGQVNYNKLTGMVAASPYAAEVQGLITQSTTAQKGQAEAQEAQNKAAAAHAQEVDRLIGEATRFQNAGQAQAKLDSLFSEGKIDQQTHDMYTGVLSSMPFNAAQQQILSGLGTVKDRFDAQMPKTELGKLRAERQRALDAGDTEAVKLYDTASRIEAGQDVSAKDKANLNLDWAKYYWSQKQNSPEYKAQVAAAEAEGKDKVTFNAKLPSVISNATQAINLIDTMIGTPEVKDKEGKVVQKATAAHPGISAVGSIFNPLTTRISGTDAANFKAYLDQVQGGAFLDAYNTLRGGGAITQVEGQKATAAVTRMNLAQSKDEFIKAAREYQEVLRKGIENAKNKSGITTSGATTSNW